MNCAHCRSPIEWDSKRNVALTADSAFWELHRCPAPPAGVINECICGELVVLHVVPHGEAPRLDWPALTPHSHPPAPGLAERRAAFKALEAEERRLDAEDQKAWRAANQPIPPVSRGVGSSPAPGGATPPRRVSPRRADGLGLPE